VDTVLPDQLDFTTTSLVSINSHSHTDHALWQTMAKMLKAYPCDAITHLDAREATHLTAALWKPAPQLLPRLETIYIEIRERAAEMRKEREVIEAELRAKGYLD
jgi:hypothetical protein